MTTATGFILFFIWMLTLLVTYAKGRVDGMNDMPERRKYRRCWNTMCERRI